MKRYAVYLGIVTAQDLCELVLSKGLLRNISIQVDGHIIQSFDKCSLNA